MLVLFLAWGEQPKLAGPRDRLGAALDAQLAVDAAGVSFDRVQGDDEFLGDVFVREALADEVEDVALAGGERVCERGRVGVWGYGRTYSHIPILPHAELVKQLLCVF